MERVLKLFNDMMAFPDEYGCRETGDDARRVEARTEHLSLVVLGRIA
jgi:hypothetical protein